MVGARLLIAVAQNPTIPERFTVSASRSFVRPTPRALRFFELEAKKRQIEAGKQTGRGHKRSAPIGADLSGSDIQRAHRATVDAAIAFDTSPRNVQRARPAGARITEREKLCYDSPGSRDEENRDEDGAFLMSTTSDDAWAAYHAAGGTWEAWVDARLAEERERILAIVTEVIAHQQREMERTVLEMRAASRPMDGRDGRSLNVRGTYNPGASYFTLDIVVCNGASFIARRDNPGPCPGDGWQLSAQQGKRGPPGPQGERGEKGRDGLSAPVITDWKLDVRTRTATPIYSDGRFGPALELGALFEQSEDK